MAYTQADVDALSAAIATGAMEVERGDERVKYRSLADMQSTLDRMKAEVAGDARVSVLRQMTPKSVRGF